ncbi:MAG: hypothetical protein A2499_00620 [Stygiobacter sp. RIFOXYC12_FULL_38_8]|nr:MAG: hypothetical protein A2299_15190 [Stygiobacter sp. RIFOXYB2_FULL_37_11]OGV10250.1 MAG: hypothetical protein A2237_12840 [Stygiobacter sp. RIFOXYA2_FULL_38_8]OGV14025.1 MAG: hypothetical protein A2440_18880 [Stygiobacter sp. RIFOXYC2_FULL_38_25]OGV30347.1 MAG: hypothetical protein A2499_00620 [Stygiobacter sp. RIFOXYC12_FULL_38_8]OGV82356.1 MAG: hypothetical protein A2X65_18365 [Stygiobacter sp. GWF2_38_21]
MLSSLNIRVKRGILFASLILINLFLITLPLTNSLGYEFVLVNSIILFFVGGITVCSKLKTESQRNFFSYFSSEYKTVLAVVLIPLIVGSFSSLFNSRCPIKDGLAFYIAIALPSYALGIIIGFLSSLVSKKYNRLIFVSVAVLLLLTSLLELYFYPQVYFYNPVFGFFPGTIYDEDVAVNMKLIWFQLFNLILYGLGLLLLRKKIYLKMKKVVIVFGLLLLITLSFVLKPLLGFATTDSRLHDELQTKISTDHFEIFLGDSAKNSEYEFIGLLHEYYYEQVTNRLDVTETPKIVSYIFNDKHQKRELFGAGNADVSKPWMDRIFLNYTNYQQTLKHEIAHTVAAKFGVTPFKVAGNLNVAMIEGLAMWIENDFDNYPVQYAAKLAYNNGYKVQLENLFNSGKFFTSYSSLAYIYSGAFLEFLAESYGAKKVIQLYGDLDFENVMGENLNSLSKQFEVQLADSAFKNRSHQAQLYFGGQTIFKKFCPRMASNDMKEAKDDYVKKDFAIAAEKYLSIYEYSSSANSLIGYSSSLIKQKKYKTSCSVLEKEIKNFRSSQFLYNLELQLADSYMLSGDSLNAQKYYSLVEEQKPHQNYSNRVKLIKLIWKTNGSSGVKSFLSENETVRANRLFNTYYSSKAIFVIPYLLGLDSAKVDLVITDLKKNFTTMDDETRKIALDVSQFLLLKKDYSGAKHFAVMAIDNSAADWEKFRAVENLRLVNWFVNFAVETKLKVEHFK